jgi:plasmid stability protein
MANPIWPAGLPGVQAMNAGSRAHSVSGSVMIIRFVIMRWVRLMPKCMYDMHCAIITVMSSTLQVRDLPDEVTATLKARAARARMSLSAYVAARLTELAASPTSEEIISRIVSRPTGPDGAATEDIIALIRRDRESR